MDIVAVQAQVEYEIDSDYEVSTIGYANLAAGLFAGGGTGVEPALLCMNHLNACVPHFHSRGPVQACPVLHL